MRGKTLRAVLLILSFLFVYAFLVALYRLGIPGLVALGGLLIGASAVALYLTALNSQNEEKASFLGVLSGLLFWALLGEILEHVGLFDLASWKMLPLLALSWLIFETVSRYLPSGVSLAGFTFNLIWLLHALMINQFEFLGKHHWSTYIGAILFGMAGLAAAVSLRKTQRPAKFLKLFLLCFLFLWGIVEYTWAWRLLPGPWMIK